MIFSIATMRWSYGTPCPLGPRHPTSTLPPPFLSKWTVILIGQNRFWKNVPAVSMVRMLWAIQAIVSTLSAVRGGKLTHPFPLALTYSTIIRISSPDENSSCACADTTRFARTIAITNFIIFVSPLLPTVFI